MGNCFSSCLSKSTDNSSRTFRNLNILSKRPDTSVDFQFLVEDRSLTDLQTQKKNFLSNLFNKKKKQKKPVLELVEGFLNPQLSAYSRLNESQRLPSTSSCTSRDIQLQYLDARALLDRTVTSTPASSLDLEWEHETLPLSMSHERSGISTSSWTAVVDDYMRENSQITGTQNSESDWSRVSSSDNSLEWDNVHNSIQESPPQSDIDVDTDTQFLLSEIERLTNQTLKETGQDLLS